MHLNKSQRIKILMMAGDGDKIHSQEKICNLCNEIFRLSIHNANQREEEQHEVLLTDEDNPNLSNR